MWEAVVRAVGAGCFQVESDSSFWVEDPRRVMERYAIDYSRPPLGTGSFGTVWRARVKSTCEGSVAVKALEKKKMKEMQVPPSLIHAEVHLLKDCTACAHVVQLHDFVETSTKYHLVMELCAGGNLDAAVKAEPRRAEEPQVASLMRQLLAAVAFLHARGICHRDVKPQNLFLMGRPSSEGARLKLGDFGIAVRVKRGELLTEKVGTPTFMAPEMHLLPDRSDGYSRGVDVWASGVVLAFLLAQQYPFVDASGRLLRDQLLRADLPLLSPGTFASLFQLVQEAAGISVERPSDAALNLVRKLLTPLRSQRLPAERALQHEWLDPRRAAAAGQGRAGSLRPAEGLCGVGCVGAEVLQADGPGGAQRPGPLPAEERQPMLLGRMEIQHPTCVVCYSRAEHSSDSGYRCPQCRHMVCAGCLDRLPKAECPYCRLRAPQLDDSEVETCGGCGGGRAPGLAGEKARL